MVAFFTYQKNVYIKVQESRLQPLYNNDPVFRENIWMIPALSFVPIQDTVAAFNELSRHSGNAEQPVLDYYETNYIGELRRGCRIPPLFEHTLWNMNKPVNDDLPRTNNHLEGWHNRFSHLFNSPHPGIWDFIETLQRDSAHNHMLLGQMDCRCARSISKTCVHWYQLTHKNIGSRLPALKQTPFSARHLL